MVSFPTMSVTRARRIAFEVLRRVETAGAYAADLLHARLGKPGEAAKREDAALATEITLGVLRWQRLLDFFLARHLDTSLVHLDLEVLLALRMGLYQMRFLTRIPTRAAVNESVELVKWARKSSAAGLVNAVLHRMAGEGSLEPQFPPDLPPAERLGISHSHPTWLVARWLEFFGEARTVALLESNNRPPRITCAVHDPRAEASLRQAGLSVEPGKLLCSAVAVRGRNPAQTKAFRRGWISIQDEASQLVALLMDVRPGQSVLDLCAAPGGKTALLAKATGPGTRVVAADLHPHRLRAMKMHLERVGATHVQRVALDATVALPLAAQFDRILVDVPCSGTGTLSRNPEIRWRLRPDDLADFHGRQASLLANALGLLARGGRLVFSTCSLEPEENEQVVAEVLAGHPDFCCANGLPAVARHLTEGIRSEDLVGSDSFLRTFPPDHHTDGFFAAIIHPKP